MAVAAVEGKVKHLNAKKKYLAGLRVFNQKRQTMVSGDGRVPLQQIPGSLLGGIAV